MYFCNSSDLRLSHSILEVLMYGGYHMAGAFIKIPTTDKQVVFGPICIIILQSGCVFLESMQGLMH